ncbi:glutathione S-transferase N-terminal domain-containing protein [Candidatus Micrarchaeota archaeon]|nr:glutathione S-transferase N-terminal domain-containing protein [Candidatus Micrarchaeota archaeon]
MIEIYTKSYCPHCLKAKSLLEKKKLGYKEIDVEHDSGRWDEMVRRSGRTTVPQIIIDGQPIGGCNGLYKKLLG